MLQIKHKHSLNFPSFTPKRRLQLAPVMADAELDSEESSTVQDWQLVERPDADQLSTFWGKVVDDLEHDPKWIKFSDD